MSYVQPSEEVTRESLARLGKNWRRLLRDAARGEHVDHVAHELVVRVELALNSAEAALQVLQNAADGASRFDQGGRDFAGAAALKDARLNVLDLRDEIAQVLAPARSLLPPDDSVKGQR